MPPRPTPGVEQVDATTSPNAELRTRFGIRGYPTIKVFRGDPNAPKDYGGPRDAPGIEAYLRRQVSAPWLAPWLAGGCVRECMRARAAELCS